MTASPTKSGTRRLSEVARKVVAPRGIATTGWPAVRQLCERKLGVTFDAWQDGAGRLILSKREDGTLAAMVDGVGLSLPRQVGKTYLIGALIFALCILRPGLLVIWSAHHSRTHGETFLAMQAFADRLRVRPYILKVYTGSGDEEIRFRNGSRILFGARERGFGRGIPAVDVMVFDEAQILSDKALANMLATMNVSAFGLALFIGTPPRPEDDSEAFSRMRRQAYAGELVDGAWIEVGAERGMDRKSPKTWAAANPSYPHRTPAQSIQRLMRKLTPEDFDREGLGIWDEDDGPKIMPAWSKRGDPSVSLPTDLVIGLAGSVDGLYGSIGAAGMSGDVLVLGAVDRRVGQRWLIDEAKRIQDERGCRVAIDPKGPLSDLVDDLEAAGVDLTLVEFAAYVDACAALWRMVEETGGVVHPEHRDLSDAVRLATWRNVGDRRVFGRRGGADISMLEAVTLAADVAQQGYDVSDSFM